MFYRYDRVETVFEHVRSDSYTIYFIATALLNSRTNVLKIDLVFLWKYLRLQQSS